MALDSYKQRADFAKRNSQALSEVLPAAGNKALGMVQPGPQPLPDCAAASAAVAYVGHLPLH